GAALFIIMMLLPPLTGLSDAAWMTAAVAVLMGVWWVSEAIPIPATALLPIVLFPLLGVSSVGSATAPFANPIIYLFMGGFIIAIAMEKSNLHKRIALNVIRIVGTKPHAIIAGFMLSSAFISMWVSNTATALMMLPIALSVVHLVEDKADIETKTLRFNFSLCLVLCIAYGCNIGGIGTLIGTPPNALMAAYMLDNYNVNIGFATWMMIGIPLVVVSLPLVYLLLTRVLFPIKLKEIPGGKELIESELARAGRMSKSEKIVLSVFLFTATMWIAPALLREFVPALRDYIPVISDTVVAIMGAMLLFLIPINFKRGEFTLGWEDTQKLPWDILVLFGGGLSLAAAISSTGLAEWMGDAMRGLDGWSAFSLMVASLTLIIFLTEITSNTATAAAFMPILASIAIAFNMDPLILVVPAAIGASCAFMLPVATPPNAIVYGSGYVSLPQMAKAGFWVNILMIMMITIVMYLLLGAVFNLTL
ncbi:MAG TPA: anion transporter, partial [Bacteroidetes bacterium]|nr:anion transporter [Bacteroidota bacterium]